MKKFVIVALILLSVSVLLAACGGGDEEPTATAVPPTATTATEAEAPAAEAAEPAGDVENGQMQFVAYCSACHGAAGEGVTGLGKDMTHSEFIAGLSDEELLEFINTGRDSGDPLNTTGVAMPPKGGNPALDDETIVDIIAFMRSIAQ